MWTLKRFYEGLLNLHQTFEAPQRSVKIKFKLSFSFLPGLGQDGLFFISPLVATVVTAKKMKFSIKDFFSIRDQIRTDLVTFAEKILNGKLYFYAVCTDIYRSCIFSNVERILYLGKHLPDKQHRPQVLKINKQFGYASIENMNKLIKNAELFDIHRGKIKTDVVSQSENCRRFKKPTHPPVTGLLRDTELKHTVSADLQCPELNIWHLRMNHKFSIFSNAVIIRKMIQ